MLRSVVVVITVSSSSRHVIVVRFTFLLVNTTQLVPFYSITISRLRDLHLQEGGVNSGNIIFSKFV